MLVCRDSRTELRKYDNVRALYQPDTIRYATIGGRGYLFTANEGDAKEERVQVRADDMHACVLLYLSLRSIHACMHACRWALMRRCK